MSTLSSVLEEELKGIFARACKNNEYFGNDGWYELHTPTLKSEIQALINQQIKSVLDELVGELDDGKNSHSMKVISSTIQKIRSRYE